MALLQSSEAKKLQSGLKVWTRSFLETKLDCGLQSKGKQCEGNTHELRKPQAEVIKVIPKPPTKQPYPDLQSLNFISVLLPGSIFDNPGYVQFRQRIPLSSD